MHPVETWALIQRLEELLASCDHKMLTHMSRVRWQDRINTSNEEVRRRCVVENLEHRLKKTRLRWFGHVNVGMRIAYLRKR
mgnify:CR=1 FL=1